MMKLTEILWIEERAYYTDEPIIKPELAPSPRGPPILLKNDAYLEKAIYENRQSDANAFCRSEKPDTFKHPEYVAISYFKI